MYIHPNTRVSPIPPRKALSAGGRLVTCLCLQLQQRLRELVPPIHAGEAAGKTGRRVRAGLCNGVHSSHGGSDEGSQTASGTQGG